MARIISVLCRQKTGWIHRIDRAGRRLHGVGKLRLTPFRDQGYSQTHDLVGVLAIDALAHELDGALVRLVFDEAHTFRGAGGAETACLIRRLRAKSKAYIVEKAGFLSNQSGHHSNGKETKNGLHLMNNGDSMKFDGVSLIDGIDPEWMIPLISCLCCHISHLNLADDGNTTDPTAPFGLSILLSAEEHMEPVVFFCVKILVF